MVVLARWLEAVETASDGDEDGALAILFDAIDQAHTDGRFQEVDELLQTAMLERATTCLLVGLLTITWVAKPHLPSRSNCFDQIKKLIDERGESTRGLLDGLD